MDVGLFAVTVTYIKSLLEQYRKRVFDIRFHFPPSALLYVNTIFSADGLIAYAVPSIQYGALNQGTMKASQPLRQGLRFILLTRYILGSHKSATGGHSAQSAPMSALSRIQGRYLSLISINSFNIRRSFPWHGL